MQRGEDEPIDIILPEKIAFIAYNVGVFESVQKFGSLIINGKISGMMDLMYQGLQNCSLKLVLSMMQK
jgi:hypothetical protein